MRRTAFGATEEITTSEKEDWSGLEKSDGRPKNFVSESWEVFKYHQGSYTDIDFHQQWCKMDEQVE